MRSGLRSCAAPRCCMLGRYPTRRAAAQGILEALASDEPLDPPRRPSDSAQRACRLTERIKPAIKTCSTSRCARSASRPAKHSIGCAQAEQISKENKRKQIERRASRDTAQAQEVSDPTPPPRTMNLGYARVPAWRPRRRPPEAVTNACSKIDPAFLPGLQPTSPRCYSRSGRTSTAGAPNCWARGFQILPEQPGPATTPERWCISVPARVPTWRSACWGSGVSPNRAGAGGHRIHLRRSRCMTRANRRKRDRGAPGVSWNTTPNDLQALVALATYLHRDVQQFDQALTYAAKRAAGAVAR